MKNRLGGYMSFSEMLGKIGRQLDDEEIKQLKKTLVNMLEDIHVVCSKYKIFYSLGFGTLLGAVRHKGFIPWDDDVDILMFDDDIPLFFELLTKEFPDKYFVGGSGYIKDDPIRFYKVMLNGTEKIEAITDNLPYVRGIDIDVFPLVMVDKNQKKHNKLKKKISRVRNIISAVYDYSYPSKSIRKIAKTNFKIRIYYFLRRLLGLVYSFHSVDEWMEKYHKLLEKGKDFQESSLYWIPSDNVSTNIIFNLDELKETTYLCFEGKNFLSIKQYSAMLNKIYGKDYMNLPPESKRVRHPIISLKYLEGVFEK